MSQENRAAKEKDIIEGGVFEKEEHHNMKPQLITLIKKNCSYGGNPLEDPKQHISSFLRTCGAVNPDGVNHDTFKLLLFPFSLKNEAAQWLETMPQGSITSWDELVTKFLTKFSSSQQNIKMKEGIQPFIQGKEEPLFKPWERYKKATDKEGFRVFYEGLTPETRRAVDYVLDNLFKATAAGQGTTDLNNKRANNQHSFETPQSATSDEEIKNLEGMKAVMSQSRQLHQQTLQQLESIARQIDFLHSTTVKTQFPLWKPHSYLRMKESQYQEQRDFDHTQPQHTPFQDRPTSPLTQNDFHRPPQLTQPQPLPTFQRIYVLEMLIERFMKIQEMMAIEQEGIKKHQEMISKNQEASLRRLERQMEQLVQNLAELGEKKGTLNPKSHEKDAGLKEKEVVEESKKSMERETEGRKPIARGGNLRQQKPQLP
ncbi:uncharacterized protein LOC130960146 [Arachis stenosperma]|uniref:uncharacterized protein LOC130960146 n=1 Tax=Arachis stenosperma TaxID=217475 RepID=UPI0025AC863E|nr:uncharacterized protein LOC130960146 [Arachis stenosperma]